MMPSIRDKWTFRCDKTRGLSRKRRYLKGNIFIYMITSDFDVPLATVLFNRLASLNMI